MRTASKRTLRTRSRNGSFYVRFTSRRHSTHSRARGFSRCGHSSSSQPSGLSASPWPPSPAPCLLAAAPQPARPAPDPLSWTAYGGNTQLTGFSGVEHRHPRRGTRLHRAVGGTARRRHSRHSTRLRRARLHGHRGRQRLRTRPRHRRAPLEADAQDAGSRRRLRHVRRQRYGGDRHEARAPLRDQRRRAASSAPARRRHDGARLAPRAHDPTRGRVRLGWPPDRRQPPLRPVRLVLRRHGRPGPRGRRARRRRRPRRPLDSRHVRHGARPRQSRRRLGLRRSLGRARRKRDLHRRRQLVGHRPGHGRALRRRRIRRQRRPPHRGPRPGLVGPPRDDPDRGRLRLRRRPAPLPAGRMPAARRGQQQGRAALRLGSQRPGRGAPLQRRDRHCLGALHRRSELVAAAASCSSRARLRSPGTARTTATGSPRTRSGSTAASTGSGRR